MQTVDKTASFESLPPEKPQDLIPQYQALLLESGMESGVELPGAELTSEGADALVEPIADELTAILGASNHAAHNTSRVLVRGPDDEGSLAIGQRASQFLVEITRRLPLAQYCVIAKGGVTASVLAIGAFAIKHATVLGQILPGIPVWQPDANSRFPGKAYVVFPGQVGDDGAPLRALRILSA